MTAYEIVKALYIFNKKTGVPFISYIPDKDFNVNPDLIINFLTTVLNFAEEIGQSNLKMFDMENFRFIFIEKQDIVFNAVTSKLVNPMDLLFKLNTIMSLFLNEFTDEELSKSIPQNQYDKFLKNIEEIINGDLRVLEDIKKTKIKKTLDKLNKEEHIIGSGVLSFAGNFLVNAFHTDSERKIIQIMFNSNFEMIIYGINKAIIEFQNRVFYSEKIDNQTLFVVIHKNGHNFEKVKLLIESCIGNIKKIIENQK